MASSGKKKRSKAYMRAKRRLGAILAVFVLIIVLAVLLVVRAVISLPYETIDLSGMINVSFSGYDTTGVATASIDDAKMSELLASLKNSYDEAVFHNTHPDDSDYALFVQSIQCHISKGMDAETAFGDSDTDADGSDFVSDGSDSGAGLSNGDYVTVTCTYDEELAEKIKLEISGDSRMFAVSGLPVVTAISVDDVFADLNVKFEGVSPGLTLELENNSTNPLVSQMIFEIMEPKDYYAAGDTVRVHAVYTDAMVMDSKYIVDVPQEECVKEYVVESDSGYVTNADDIPLSILSEAVEQGKKAFKDANEYGVRIYCEANLVPVYINKKATFKYGTPKYVSSYFKSVLPEKAGTLGLSYNDFDIIYEVKITQADGVSCKAYAAVRFSNIIKNSDNSYSYDFSDPKILSESYFSENVKSNVTSSYEDTHKIERVYL